MAEEEGTASTHAIVMGAIVPGIMVVMGALLVRKRICRGFQKGNKNNNTMKLGVEEENDIEASSYNVEFDADWEKAIREDFGEEVAQEPLAAICSRSAGCVMKEEGRLALPGFDADREEFINAHSVHATRRAGGVCDGMDAPQTPRSEHSLDDAEPAVGFARDAKVNCDHVE